MRRTQLSRRMLRLVLLILIPLVAVAAGSYVYLIGGRYVSTENAYVKADIIHISADVEGRVVEVGVRNQEFVEAGDLLFRIDPERYGIALSLAEAELARVVNDLAALRAEYHEAAAELAEAQERTQFLDRQADRLRNLRTRGVASEAALDEAEFELAAARDAVTVIRQRMLRVLANLGGDLEMPVEKHPMFLEADARRDRAALDYARTEVRAPTDGIVTNMRLQAGEFVEAGTAVFGIVSAGDPWVEANLKETELTHVRAGQDATVTVDAYPDLQWDAVVESISPATGAEFAILPPQNATGNWVKVVQRLPVRLHLLEHPSGRKLRAGMTVAVTIDTERERELLTVIKTAWASLRGADPSAE